MSSNLSKSHQPTPERQALIETLVFQLSRQLSTQTVLMHAAIAEAMGLSQGDHKALDLLNDAEQAGALMTAGQLAEAVGLSTGTVTSLIDRLEKANLVRRSADPHDRRKVVLEPTHARDAEGGALFASIAAAAMELAERYTDAELAVISDYVRRNIELSEKETARLRNLARKE
ncbi:MAG: MarR family transcriptional regulator [Caldilineaceae bacterium]